MTLGLGARVAIVDYGMGNLFSVEQACIKVGLPASIATTPEEILSADGVILPGVGAFGDAMSNLEQRGLTCALQEFARSGKPLVGICLGMQLLMTESHEFGHHRGLGIVEGEVVRLEGNWEGHPKVKIPHVGWNRIYSVWPEGARIREPKDAPRWEGTPLEGLCDGDFMYFVHSYQPRPRDPGLAFALTQYGANRICSAFRQGSVFACQFHPERSGPKGLRLYHNLARMIKGAARPERTEGA